MDAPAPQATTAACRPRFLEGGWCDTASALVSEWPSKAAALAFWNSPEYAAAKKLREGAGEFQVLLIESA